MSLAASQLHRPVQHAHTACCHLQRSKATSSVARQHAWLRQPARTAQRLLVQLWLHCQRWVLDAANRLGEALKYRQTALRSAVGPRVLIDPHAEEQLFEVWQPAARDACRVPRLFGVQGWGTSLAWFANALGQRSQVRERLADLLFSEAGLALSIVRYNIGGAGPHSPDKDNLRPGANVARWESARQAD